MNNPFLNIFRGVVTTIIGDIMILASLYFFFFGGDEWVGYEGYLIGSFVVGIVLLIMPDDIPSFVRQVADKYVFKKDKPQ